jgi:hypothetical protein
MQEGKSVILFFRLDKNLILAYGRGLGIWNRRSAMLLETHAKPQNPGYKWPKLTNCTNDMK